MAFELMKLWLAPPLSITTYSHGHSILFFFHRHGFAFNQYNTSRLAPTIPNAWHSKISSFFCAISKAIITPSSLGISFSSNSTKLNLLLKIGERDEIVLVLKHNPMSYAFIFLVEFHCSPFDLLEEAIDDKVLLF